MKEFSRCPSCNCAVDDKLHGHHSAADCSILKYAEDYADDVRAQRDKLLAVLKVIQKLGTHKTMDSRSFDGDIFPGITVLNDYAKIAREAIKEVEEA